MKKLAALALVCTCLTLQAQSQTLDPHQKLTLAIYRELIEINTVHPHGDNTAAARAMAKLQAHREGRLLLWPWHAGRQGDGRDLRGELHSLQEGRLAAEARDLIIALTADKEGGTHNGVGWLLTNRRELIDAEFALNEGGGGTHRNGRPYIHGVQVSEKLYVTFDMEATNAGGHSSVPPKDNAIYDLSAALDRLSRFDFPVRLSYDTCSYFSTLAGIETGAMSGHRGVRPRQGHRCTPENRSHTSP